ncbi:MAG: GNAT family N-acetyltransferase, partial [Phycisphaerae bacterium]|nr:GNAT family N-acetyltransferase [Phycisphaerae bacterium]
EVEALPAERTLAAAGGLRAVMARAEDIPNVLLEIGRLRERTFRAVGEGTGAERDLDGFDRTYRHLFVWDDARRRVIGAYRLGLTDELCADGRPEGLYTATLFRYRPEQMRLLVPGIELGRSFVRAEAQKGYAPLLLLWQGIGRFVAENPKYRLLFGTASISDTYPSLTRKLLVRFLTATCGPGEFARLAEPTSPPRFARGRERETELACRTIGSVEEADALVASIDPHGRGIPVLLRQYLGLGARLIGFNVDAAFGNALDGLIVVDLTRAPRRLVSRYMGAARYEAYLRHHGVR